MSDRPQREAAAGPWSRADTVHALLLALVTALTWIPRWRGPIDLRFDAGVYYTLGTSLAEGRGYRLLNEPGEIQAIQYPPLLPALVAAHQVVLGTSDPLVVAPVLRKTSLVLSFALVLASYVLARRHLRPRAACVAALIVALYFHAVYLEDLLFAEVPFALATLGLVLADGAGTPARRRWAYPCAAAAFFLRTAGVAVLGAWALAALLARDRRAFVGRALLALVCVGTWQGYVRHVTHGEEYRSPAYEYQRAPYQYYNVSYAENVALLDPFRPEAGPLTSALLARRVGENALRLTKALGETVTIPLGFWEWPLRSLARELDRYVPLRLALLPVVFFGALVLLGLALLWRRSAGLVLIVLCSLALIAVTPWPAQFLRYLMPFSPFLALALVLALESLGRVRAWFFPACAAVVLGAQVLCLRQTFARFHHEVVLPGADAPSSLFLFEERREWRAFYAGLAWLRTNAPEDACVATSCPLLVWLHAGRKAVMPPLDANVAEARRLLDAVPVDYVVVDALDFVDMSRQYALPVVQADPSTWEPVFRSGEDVVIYRRSGTSR